MPLNAIEMNNANAKRRWNGQIGGVRERETHTSDTPSEFIHWKNRSKSSVYT